MYLICLSVILMGLAAWLCMKKNQDGFAFAISGPGEDSDMKIAPAFPSRRRKADDGEAAATAFLQQKENGNIDRAYQLGAALAAYLLGDGAPALSVVEASDDPVVIFNRKLLFSFAVDSVLENELKPLLLSQVSVNYFYEQIQKKDPPLHRRIFGPEAYSLYLLCEKDWDNRYRNIGAVFADLCDKPEDEHLVALGNELYALYCDFCRKNIQQAAFV